MRNNILKKHGRVVASMKFKIRSGIRLSAAEDVIVAILTTSMATTKQLFLLGGVPTRLKANVSFWYERTTGAVHLYAKEDTHVGGQVKTV